MSLKDNNNIEELFRSGLEDFELPVNEAMWSNISNGMSNASASSAGASATTGSKMLTYLGLSGAACVVGVVATLLYTSNTTETSADTNVEVDQTSQTTTEITNKIQDKVVPASFDDKTIVEKITEQPSVDEGNNDPVIKETPKEKKKVVMVAEKEQQYYQGSWVNNFLTPKSKPYTEPTENSNSEVAESNVTADPDKDVVPHIEEVEKGEIIASIVAMPVGGYAPLEVSFAHHSEKGIAIWDFGDGRTVKEDNPSHVFEKYGKYTVTLTLKDKEGNEYKDYRVIEVLANSALTNIPNIFTPNGDGENDRLRLEGKNIESYHLAILNLEGKIIYQSEDLEDSWDGKNVAGDDVKEGTYVLVVSATGIDGKKYEHSGTIVLKR